MKKFLLSGLFLCLFSQGAFAEALPKRTGYDNRIKDVTYNPDNVTRVNVAIGVATIIQLSPNEFISEQDGGIGLGDPKAWKINAKGNHIWIRPMAEEPDTNLALVTNKRTYQFNLVSVKNRNAATWTVRFNYPKPAKDTNAWSRPCSGSQLNYRYFAKGDKELFPIEMWDNGTFTCINTHIGKDLPVVFKKLPDGSEGLVNSHIKNGFIVIHEVNPEYRLRLGDLVAGIKTDRLKYRNSSHFTGTTNGKQREIIDDNE